MAARLTSVVVALALAGCSAPKSSALEEAVWTAEATGRPPGVGIVRDGVLVLRPGEAATLDSALAQRRREALLAAIPVGATEDAARELLVREGFDAAVSIDAVRRHVVARRSTCHGLTCRDTSIELQIAEGRVAGGQADTAERHPFTDWISLGPPH